MAKIHFIEMSAYSMLGKNGIINMLSTMKFWNKSALLSITKSGC